MKEMGVPQLITRFQPNENSEVGISYVSFGAGA